MRAACSGLLPGVVRALTRGRSSHVADQPSQALRGTCQTLQKSTHVLVRDAAIVCFSGNRPTCAAWTIPHTSWHNPAVLCGTLPGACRNGCAVAQAPKGAPDTGCHAARSARSGLSADAALSASLPASASRKMRPIVALCGGPVNGVMPNGCSEFAAVSDWIWRFCDVVQES